MPSRLIYVPIESYKSRYTEYMSTDGGVYETCFREAGVDFQAIRPWHATEEIKNGIVLDYNVRSQWSFNQVLALLEMLSKGQLDPKQDAIYFEDFWTPGFEMIPYAQCLKFGYSKAGHVPVYSFCHAQSTDPYDFTADMAYWMRPMEQSWATYQRAVMCSSKEMVHQWRVGQLPYERLRWCGHSFHSGVIKQRFGVPEVVNGEGREDRVVYSSRWDTEKNPWFFLALAEKFQHERPNVRFVICTSLKELTSNDPQLLELLYCKSRPNVDVVQKLTKQQYFEELRRAKVQFNCASQDFVSYCLLDAALNGCAPLYPHRLTFPDALNNSNKNLYAKGDADFNRSSNGQVVAALQSAADKLNALLDSPWESYEWLCKKYEGSTRRKLAAIGFDVKAGPSMQTLCSMSVEEIKDVLCTN